jgi:hypothetical protein
MPNETQLAKDLHEVAEQMSSVSADLDRLLAILRPPSLRENLRVIDGRKDT